MSNPEPKPAEPTPAGPATPTEAPSEWARVARAVNAIASQLAKKPGAGTRSELRRLRYDQPGGAAFYRLAATELADLLPPGDGSGRDQAERRWSALLAALAHAPELHRPGRPLGGALAAAGVSELRVLRLLRAHGDSLLDSLRPITHQLTTAGQAFDFVDLAFLVLSDSRADEEQVRRRIARSFFGAQSATTTSEQANA